MRLDEQLPSQQVINPEIAYYQIPSALSTFFHRVIHSNRCAAVNFRAPEMTRVKPTRLMLRAYICRVAGATKVAMIFPLTGSSSSSTRLHISSIDPY